MSDIDEELAAIAEELRVLEKQKSFLLQKREVLLSKQSDSDSRILISSDEPLSTEKKLDIFQNLFRGRDDIYALRWENRQGRSGYSVACENEWQKGLCHKPKTKCGECDNRVFKEINRSTIYDHLSGKITVGLYPLLSNDDCYFLAVDFDKSDWQVAVSAFRTVCLEFGIDCVVERSRSGNGAHIWIFFEQAISAKNARRLGFLLLDKAMEKYSVIGFDSYDRLFPNQDVMPSGGFGNLIALPLQYFPRKNGNSEFIDKDFRSYPDQWKFLSKIQKVKVSEIDEFLDSTDESDKLDKSDSKPWEKNLPVAKNIISDCPETLEIVFANRIYIPVESLPQPLIARLKRIASFSNPVFFKTQALRFSTNGIPRFISLSRIEQGYLSVPRGCLDQAQKLLGDQNISVEFDDKRQAGKRLSKLKFKGDLRKDQKKAVTDLSKHDVGVLHAPTAFGKTVTAIGLIIKRKVNTLILVHSRQLLDQWKERLNAFVEGSEIGVIGGGKRKPSLQIDIATYQSLIDKKSNTVNEAVFEYGQIIIDECHHLSAPRYEALLDEIHCRYVLGITATPNRQDGHQPIIFMQAGPVRHHVKSDASNQFEQVVIVRQLYHQPPLEFSSQRGLPNISKIYHWLQELEDRNQQIIEDVVATLKNGRKPLILTERRDHAEELGNMLEELKISFLVLRGAMKAKERQEAISALETAEVLVATGKYIGEGFDLPKLDTLFLALPISWKGSLAQYAGRIHRQFTGKERVMIFDYVDENLPTLQRMFHRRIKGYDAMGYTLTYPEKKQTLVQRNMDLSEFADK